jgi:hypothetical protein
MSRHGPESGGPVLRVDQKSGQFSKLMSKKKNEMILKKMSFECMLLY